MPEKILGKLNFVFNKRDNGGEALMLTTTFVDNGDPEPGIYTNQQLTLNSYCNSASFNLSGASITPKILRELANELEAKQVRMMAEAQAQRSRFGGLQNAE